MADDHSHESRPETRPSFDEERNFDPSSYRRKIPSFSDDDDGKTPYSTDERFRKQIGVWSQNLAKYLETLPPSKRFFVTLVGFFGGLLILASIFFGVRALFAPSTSTHGARELREAFVGLDATLKADNAKINEELMLIVDDMDSSTQLMNKGVPEESDFALAMRNEFRTIGWDNTLPHLRRYVSRNPWRLGFLEIKSQLPVLDLADEKRLAIRQVLDRPGADMQLSYTLDQSGFALNKRDRDNLWGYVHLEEYELGRALTGMTLQAIRESEEPPKQWKPDMAAALDALCHILKAAEIASRQKELNLRYDATYIRENALDTLHALMQHPQFGSREATRMLQILENQLANWPSDALAFEGERTAAVWIYEHTRRGHLLEVAAPQDISSLQELGSLVGVEQSILRNIDTDEIFYLVRMSEIIFLCGKPYYERFPLLLRWEDDLNVQRDDLNAYPALAAAVLLRDVRTIMRRLATDRARTEAWVLALGTSLKQPSKHVDVHPMTGHSYRVHVSTDPNFQGKSVVSVNWLDSEELIDIPAYARTDTK